MSISKHVVINGKVKRLGNYAHVKNYRRKKKEKLKIEFGGKCCLCGYSKCLAALEFHHIDKKTKSFGIATMGLGLSYSKVLEEAKKCILVCSNCHAEIHYGGLVVSEGLKPSLSPNQGPVLSITP